MISYDEFMRDAIFKLKSSSPEIDNFNVSNHVMMRGVNMNTNFTKLIAV